MEEAAAQCEKATFSGLSLRRPQSLGYQSILVVELNPHPLPDPYRHPTTPIISSLWPSEQPETGLYSAAYQFL